MSKMTWKSEAATVAGVVVAVLPMLMGKVPEGSVWASVLGAALALATYVAGWKYEKVQSERTLSMAEAVRGMPGNPTKPQP